MLPRSTALRLGALPPLLLLLLAPLLLADGSTGLGGSAALLALPPPPPAPSTFTVTFFTDGKSTADVGAGDIAVTVTRSWAPIGAAFLRRCQRRVLQQECLLPRRGPERQRLRHDLRRNRPVRNLGLQVDERSMAALLDQGRSCDAEQHRRNGEDQFNSACGSGAGKSAVLFAEISSRTMMRPSDYTISFCATGELRGCWAEHAFDRARLHAWR
jgi:hypothetical protein